MAFQITISSSGPITIPSAYFFANSSARDSYFSAHPSELILDVVIVVSSTYEQWNGSSWTDITSIVQGPAGVGIPTGGLIHEVLAKQSGSNYDAGWEAATGTGNVNSDETSTSAGQIVVFSDTGGHNIAKGTQTGILKATSGVISPASSGTDYEPPVAAGTSTEYYRGDKSFQTVNSDELSEGSTHKFYADALYRQSIHAFAVETENYEYLGFVDISESEFVFDDTTRTLTIQAKSPATTFRVVNSGTVTYYTSESVQWPNTDGLHIFYFNLAGVLATGASLPDLTQNAMVSIVHWDVAAQKSIRRAEERHGCIMDGKTHEYLHLTRGCVYQSGFDAANFATSGDGSLDSEVQIAFNGGTLWDEDIKLSIVHNATPSAYLEQNLYPAAYLPIFYQTTGNIWKQIDATAYPLHVISGFPLYNDFTLPASPTLTEVPDGYYFAMWVTVTNGIENPVISLMGQRVDDNITDARNLNLYGSINFGSLIVPEYKVIYRLIYHVSSTYTNTFKATLVDVQDTRRQLDSGRDSYIPQPIIVLHSQLGGLSSDDHTQYALLAGRPGQTLNTSEVILSDLTIASGPVQSQNLSTAIEALDDSIYAEGNTGFGAWTTANSPYWDISGGQFRLFNSGYGYIKGKKVTWTASPGTPQTLTAFSANTLNYIYIDSAGLLQSTTTVSAALFLTNIIIFEVLYDGTNYVGVKENHPYSFNTAVSGYLHKTLGCVLSKTYGSNSLGATIAKIGTGNGASATDRQVKIVGAAVAIDHGLETTIPDSGGSPITWRFFYTNASGFWVQHVAQTEMLSDWNNAGTLTALVDPESTIYRLYVSKDNLNTSTPEYFAIIDTSVYASLGDAQTAIANGTVAIPTNELFDLEVAQLGYVIVTRGVTYTYIVNTIVEKQVIGAQYSGGGNTTQAALTTVDTTNLLNNLTGITGNAQAMFEAIDLFNLTPTSPAAPTDYVELIPVVGGATEASPFSGDVKIFSRTQAYKPSINFKDSAGIEWPIQAALFRKNITWWNAIVGSTSMTAFGGVTGTVTGTATARSLTSTNYLTQMKRTGFTTAAAANSLSGIRSVTTQWFLGNAAGMGGLFYVCRFGITTISPTARLFLGLSASTAAPTNVEPNTINNSIGICKLTASSNLAFVSRDGSAATTTDLGANFPASANTAYELRIYADQNSGNISLSLERLDSYYYTETVFTGNPPTRNTFMCLQNWMCNVAAGANSFDIENIYVETEY